MKTQITLVSALTASAFGGHAAAQAIVSPAHFARPEGNTSSSLPFGTTTVPQRYLQVHDDLAQQARTIAALWVRRDGFDTGGAKEGYSLLLDIYLSTAATTAAAPSKTFDANHGANKKRVAAFRQVIFPAVPAPVPGHVFEFKVPFDAPYAFDGQGPLCWEVQILSRQGTAGLYHDVASGSSTNPGLMSTRTGTGCRVTGATTGLSLSGSGSMNWASKIAQLSYSLTAAPKNGVTVLNFGFSRTSFGALPLPLELPGTGTAPSKACTLYNDIVFGLPVFTTATGTGTINLALPATPELNGFSLHAQALAPDAAANAFGLVLSGQQSFQWVAPYGKVPVGQVSANGTLNADGTATANTGLIVKFE